jgi:uncharacterized protein
LAIVSFCREDCRLHPYGFETHLKHHSSYAEMVLEEIRQRGPLPADELPDPEGVSRRLPGSWHRSVPRAVLEAHFARGRLAIASRLPNFARVYDLSDRLIPSAYYSQCLEKAESQRTLLAMAARAHGIGTVADLADYYRMPVSEARPRLLELVEQGEIVPVRVEGWKETAFLYKKARPSRCHQVSALLSPFDPLVWCRKRIDKLFCFDYRLEIFTPQARRRWGCYVLPFLHDGRLAARVDLKADRTAGRLRVLAAYLESHANPIETATALARELKVMSQWLNLESVKVEKKTAFLRELYERFR